MDSFFFFLLSYLVCSQIWLNYFLNDCHFDYNKILKINPATWYLSPPSALPRPLSFFSGRKKLEKGKRPNEEVVAKEGKRFEQ